MLPLTVFIGIGLTFKISECKTLGFMMVIEEPESISNFNFLFREINSKEGNRVPRHVCENFH